MVDLERRLMSVDVVRGLAIMGVLFIHATIYGIWQTETNALNIVSIYVVVAFIPLILMGTWGGGFPLISSLVGTYLVYNRMKKDIPFKRAVVPIIINSTILLLLDPVRGLLFGRTWTNTFSDGFNYSILTGLLDKGVLMAPTGEKLMQIGSLPSIGLSGYLTVFLLWILFRRGGKEKTKRNVIILLTLGIVLAGASNFINEALFPYTKSWFNKGGVFIFFAYLLRLFVGAQLSFFPIGIYAIFGMIAGYLFAQKKEYKWIKRYGLSTGFLFLGGFAITTALTLSSVPNIVEGLFGILDYEIYPRELFFFSLGCMMLILVWLAKKFEYTSIEKKIILAKKTAFIRRFGVATLSIYFFEPFFNNLLAKLFHYIFGDPTVFGAPDAFMSNVPAILL
ncbi:MAG: hypothetical protein ACTSSF_13290, partial [Candidatus Heimdallarchaeaceae archaeon]